jgi:bis(5'-nucleosyl)-tetraphosphatase (symmetrical)
MATYAIGDIQGCCAELEKLLTQIPFNPAADRLWFVGDLVNRGPNSLDVLRLVKALGDAAIIVLGNHDLHLLAVAAGIAKMHRSDTLQEILSAPDRDELLAWLRAQRLIYRENKFVLLHAGLLPNWTITQAQELASEVEKELHGHRYVNFLQHLYGNQPSSWRDDLLGWDRLRVITNALTRMRICTAAGEMEFKFNAELPNIPAGYYPWFDVPGRANADAIIICGHWSALGLKIAPNVIALDTGCLWGGALTAIRLEDRKIFQVPCISLTRT